MLGKLNIECFKTPIFRVGIKTNANELRIFKSSGRAVSLPFLNEI
jgi:hypothetical protein